MGGGAWRVYRFKGGGLGKKEGVVFLMGVKVDTLMHTMYPTTPIAPYYPI